MWDFAGRVVEGNRTKVEMNENKRSIFHCFFVPLHSSSVYKHDYFYEVQTWIVLTSCFRHFRFEINKGGWKCKDGIGSPLIFWMVKDRKHSIVLKKIRIVVKKFKIWNNTLRATKESPNLKK
jgi:hypothetical protein